MEMAEDRNIIQKKPISSLPKRLKRKHHGEKVFLNLQFFIFCVLMCLKETMRFGATAAARAQQASAATMRAQQQQSGGKRGGGFIERVDQEFDLLNPPEEEKTPFKAPTLESGVKVLSLAISTLDGKRETIEASESWTVDMVLKMMASKLNLWQISFFALSETDGNPKNPDRWLNPHNSLKEENLKSGCSLVFKIKYFKYPKKLRDPMAIHYFYVQTRANVLSGVLEVSQGMAFRLASLQYTIQQQCYRPQDHRVGVLQKDMANFIPKVHLDDIEQNGLSLRYLERRLLGATEQHKGFSTSECLYGYLKIVKDLPLYGAAVFHVKAAGVPRTVGVAEDGILISSLEQPNQPQYISQKGKMVSQPKFEFTAYEDITHIKLNGSTVTVVILSDTDSATHVFNCTETEARSMAELMGGYRRMLEAYVKMPPMEFPVYPVVPHPALYAKPVKRSAMQRFTTRADLFKQHYLRLCKERNAKPYLPLLRQVDLAIDTATPMENLSLAGYKWGSAQFALLFDSMIAAVPYTQYEDEEFVENMQLKMIDFSENNILEKGFFTELGKYFSEIGKHPYEVKGLCFRHCRLDDKSMAALKPFISNLKSLQFADFSRNALKESGVHNVILGVRDANASFTEMDLTGCLLKEPKIMKLVAAMLDKNSRLIKLKMAGCGITDMGILFLLKGLVGHKMIKTLDLSGNNLGSSNASADLFNWATRSPSLEEFRMAKTGMPKKSVKSVMACFSNANTIKCIDISGNDYGPKGSTAILGELAKNTMLEEVHLGGLDITDKNMESLLKFIRRMGKQLIHLDLRSTPLGKKGLGVVLDELAEHTDGGKFKVLDLSRMHFIGKTNGTNLVSFLKRSKTLEKLIMSGCIFDKESWPLFCRAIQQSEGLFRVDLDLINVAKQCPLGPLKDALRQVPNVREISLRGCDLSHETLLSFLEVLDVGTNSALSLIDVRGNKEIVDVFSHKKYGKRYMKLYETTYMELKHDSKKK